MSSETRCKGNIFFRKNGGVKWYKQVFWEDNRLSKMIVFFKDNLRWELLLWVVLLSPASMFVFPYKGCNRNVNLILACQARCSP